MSKKIKTSKAYLALYYDLDHAVHSKEMDLMIYSYPETKLNIFGANVLLEQLVQVIKKYACIPTSITHQKCYPCVIEDCNEPYYWSFNPKINIYINANYDVLHRKTKRNIKIIASLLNSKYGFIPVLHFNDTAKTYYI